MRTIREVMDMDVKNLELSVRCNNCMTRMEIKKLCELTALSKDEISNMRNIGKKSIEEQHGKLELLKSDKKSTDFQLTILKG